MSSPAVPKLEPANWYERRVLLADSIVAVICLVLLGLMGARVYSDQYGIATIALPFGMCIAMAIRRTYPFLFVSFIATLAVLEMLFLPTSGGASTDLIVVVAVHTAARYCPRWFGRAALGLAYVGSAWASYHWFWKALTDQTPLWQYLALTAFMAGVATISYALGRAQLAKVRAIDSQVAALAERNRLLQHEHEQQLLLATEEERTRLAAETHDILAHSLAIIVAQADGAAMLAGRDPARVQQAIEQIADTSREALDEIRVKVAALRRGEDPSGDLAPAKSLADLDPLVESVGRAGLTVTLHASNGLDAIPAGTALTAYRIVQEALTNTLKHAGPLAHASVSIVREHGTLTIQVTDDGRGTTSSDGEGNGLRGMRSRAAQYGGVLDAGPQPGGGFAVRAVIPLPLSQPAVSHDSGSEPSYGVQHTHRPSLDRPHIGLKPYSGEHA